MSKKTKKKAQEKKRGRNKALAGRTNAIESTLKKLLHTSKRIITRQKRAKGRGKQLAKNQKGLQRRVKGVETQAGKQLQRIRDLAAKNSSVRERLKKQVRITKENSKRLDKFEPRLADSQQLSQQLDQQISNLLALIDNIQGHSKDLEQGLASLELKLNEQIEGQAPAAAATRDPGLNFEDQSYEEALPPQLVRLAGSPAEATEWADEQRDWLEGLQNRLEVLENDYTDLEEGNRRLVLSIEALSDREQELDEQYRRVIQQSQTLEAGQVEQQRQIGGLNDQITGIREQVEKLADDMPDNHHLRSRDVELQQQLDGLQQGMEALQTERGPGSGGLSDSLQQQLHEAGDREQSLRRQIDQLGGLLVTTEGKLTENNARLGLEHARLAEQVQQLEQRLTAPEVTATEPQADEIQSFRELSESMQRRLEGMDDSEQTQRQQIDRLSSLLESTGEELSKQDARLGLTDGRLAEQSQQVEQRLATLESTLDGRLTKEHQSLRELGDTMQQELRAARDSEQSLGQQIDHLGSLLLATEGKMGAQSADIFSLDSRLTEQSQQLDQRLVGLESTVSEQQTQELASLRGMSENLQRQLRESSDRERSLTRRVDDLDGVLATTGDQLGQQHTKLANQASGQQAIELKQNRLVSGLFAGGVLILALGLAGYWLRGQQIAKNQTTSQQQIEEIRQQLLSQEPMLTEKQGPSESTAGLDEFAARMTLLESRLEKQDQRLALRGGRPIEEKGPDPAALEDLRQGLTEQKQQISQHQGEMEQLREAVRQLEAVQRKTEKSLQRLQDSTLKATEYRQERAKVQTEDPASNISPKDLKGASWLRGLNPDYYTIQLVAAHNEAVIGRVADIVEQADGLAYYKGQYQGRDWYVLLYGEFPTVEQAQSAGRELSEQIKAFKPWIRRISWVHRELADQP